MNEIPLPVLGGALLALILLSAFFSGAETALMTMNRYRLLNLVREGHPGAMRAHLLLQRPDRLIGFILLGNNFANILASSLLTVVALKIWGEAGIAASAGILTIVILIFSEVAPKTLGAMHPERVGFPSAFIILPLLRLFYPVVWVVNSVANLFLRCLGYNPQQLSQNSLSKDELRTVIAEAGAMIPERYQNMLISILDLESATTEDVMRPRGEIVGIDLDDELSDIVEQIRTCPHSRVPVYRQSIDKVFGILHIPGVSALIGQDSFCKETITANLAEVYFIPENTALHRVLLDFRREHQRIGLVVDEYGDVLGLVTLEDVLQEIVGEFSLAASSEVKQERDGTYLVEASLTARELNRVTGWNLPTEGPKTINGLIIEYLETIPDPGTTLRLFEYRIEIVETKGNAIRLVRFYPPER